MRPTDLTPERWARVQALFHEAMRRPPAERAGYLDAACDDAEVRREVDALLEADEAPAPIFEQPAGGLAADLEAAADDYAGRTVGPYRILGELGRGGMGTVYLAERADIGKRVALKVARDVFASPERRRRFLLERRVLAQLGHPYIARILDAGTTESGAPYFAMEVVDGQPITEACDARALPIEARLRLFLDVCEAVQAAHQALVVHRDLKPSNILVTQPEPDGALQVRLLDFGIAKLLEEADEDLTQTGLSVMTPAYAAPEQVRGEPVSTATDVYALGLVLYELLAGRRPYDVEGRASHEVAEAVLHAEPRRPSTVAADASVAAERSASPDRLVRRLRGDLDTICLKALQKEPARRYVSASELRADIERYLGGLPIAARPDALGYRAGKFVRRHRRAVAAVAAGAAVLVALTGFYTAGLAEQRNRAEAEAAKAEQVSRYLVDLFEASDPFAEGASDSLTVEALLGRGVEQADALDGQPLVQAEMLYTLGQIHVNLSRHDAAARLLHRALALRQRHLGEQHPDVAESLHGLGRLHGFASAFDSAEVYMRQALALRERLLPPDHPDVAISLNGLADVLVNQGENEAAEPHLRRALRIQQAAYGGPHEELGHTQNNLAISFHNRGDYPAAGQHYQEALATYRAVYGPDHPQVGVLLGNLAGVHENQGDLAAAESLLTEGIRAIRASVGTDHYHTANALLQLGVVQHKQRKLEASERTRREALAINERVLGPDHLNTVIAGSQLAQLLRDRGDYAAAEPLLRRAAAVFERELGSHYYTGSAFCNLAYVRYFRGDHAEADALFRKGRPVLEAALPSDHEVVVLTGSRHGRVLHALGRHAEAEPLLKAGHEFLVDRLGSEHARTAEEARQLAALYESWGRPAQAALYAQAE